MTAIERVVSSGAFDARRFITRALAEPIQPFPTATSVDVPAVVETATDHGVLVLLGDTLRAAGTLGGWPSEFCAAFDKAERKAAAIDCIRQVELASVVDALNGAGVRALLLKGAALAHTHYRVPHLRGRTDADILIAPADRSAVEHAVRRLGYLPQDETTGRLVSYQRHFGRQDRHGVFHALDVHWKISNRHDLAERLAYDELWVQRTTVPALGESAVTVSSIHALLLALVHRSGHHPGSSNILWIYDLHLLAGRLTDSELDAAVRLAVSRGLASIACDGLEAARDCFSTPRLDATLRAIRESVPHEGKVARVIPERWAQVDIVRHDLRSLTTWSERGRLVREHLFPPASYIRGKYGLNSPLLLPALYAWRIVSGAPRWLKRHDATG